MEYDHSRKAGNRGDVWKHAVLVAVADLIPASSDTFYYLDCDAGAPDHELRLGGGERGVGNALRNAPCDCQYSAIAMVWVRSNRYPAGWVFAVSRLPRRFSRVCAVLCDTADQVAAKYPPKPGLGIPSNVVVEFRHTDGFAVARTVDKPDLVFLDPPFHPDADADWQVLETVCQRLAQRGLPLLAWYPFYWPTRPQQLVDPTKCSAWEVCWTSCGSKPSQNPKGCGMLASDKPGPLFRDMETKLRRISASLGCALLVREPTIV